MNTIDININSGKLESFSVELNEDKLEIAATIGLYAGQKRITSFVISNRSYSNTKFDVPPEMIEPIFSIARQIETIAILQCRKAMAELPEPESC